MSHTIGSVYVLTIMGHVDGMTGDDGYPNLWVSLHGSRQEADDAADLELAEYPHHKVSVCERSVGRDGLEASGTPLTFRGAGS